MVFIDTPVSLDQLWKNRQSNFSELLKFAIDIKNEWIVIDGEMHADCETVLLEKGSRQENIWGANIYPENDGDDFLEFSSFINIRPSLNNLSMDIQSTDLCERIRAITERLLQR